MWTVYSVTFIYSIKRDEPPNVVNLVGTFAAIFIWHVNPKRPYTKIFKEA